MNYTNFYFKIIKGTSLLSFLLLITLAISCRNNAVNSSVIRLKRNSDINPINIAKVDFLDENEFYIISQNKIFIYYRQNGSVNNVIDPNKVVSNDSLWNYIDYDKSEIEKSIEVRRKYNLPVNTKRIAGRVYKNKNNIQFIIEYSLPSVPNEYSDTIRLSEEAYFFHLTISLENNKIIQIKRVNLYNDNTKQSLSDIDWFANGSNIFIANYPISVKVDADFNVYSIYGLKKNFFQGLGQARIQSANKRNNPNIIPMMYSTCYGDDVLISFFNSIYSIQSQLEILDVKKNIPNIKYILYFKRSFRNPNKWFIHFTQGDRNNYSNHICVINNNNVEIVEDVGQAKYFGIADKIYKLDRNESGITVKKTNYLSNPTGYN